MYIMKSYTVFTEVNDMNTQIVTFDHVDKYFNSFSADIRDVCSIPVLT